MQEADNEVRMFSKSLSFASMVSSVFFFGRWIGPHFDRLIIPYCMMGRPGFYALVVFFLFAWMAAVALVVLAVNFGFWVEKRPFLALLASRRSTVYQYLLNSSGFPGFRREFDTQIVPLSSRKLTCLRVLF